MQLTHKKKEIILCAEILNKHQRARGIPAEEWIARGRAAAAQALVIHPQDTAARRLQTEFGKLP